MVLMVTGSVGAWICLSVGEWFLWSDCVQIENRPLLHVAAGSGERKTIQ